MSFDENAKKTARVHFVLGIVAFAVLSALAFTIFGLQLGLVAISPVIGVAVSVFVVKHGAGGTIRFFKRIALNEFQGVHHAFNDHTVSVRWQDGDCKTLASDVFDILKHQADATMLRRLALQYGNDGFFKDEQGLWWFGESALLDWLRRRSQKLDQQTLSLQRWFEKDVFPPMRKKAELAESEESKN